MTRIKICGITDAETGRAALQMGANYIGFVCDPDSPRYISALKIKQLLAGMPNIKLSSVLVFRKASLVDILNAIVLTGIQHIQLHQVDLHVMSKLPKYLRKIVAVSNQRELNFMMNHILEKDYLLLDSDSPGTGTPYAHQNMPDRAFFLAGGLRVENVLEKINQFKPFAVDVSSGVETLRGIKNMTLIKQFIEKVKS